MRFVHTFNGFDQQHESPGLCSFGITEAIGGIIAGVAASAGASAAAAGVIGTVGTGALLGAGAGAVGSALTGGKPLVGALTGGLTGGVTGGLAGPVSGALGISQGAAGALVGGVTDAGLGAITNPQNPLGGALSGGLTGAATGYGLGNSGLFNAATDPAAISNSISSSLGAGGNSSFMDGGGGGPLTDPASQMGAGTSNLAVNSAAAASGSVPAASNLGNASAGSNNGSGTGLFGGKISNTSLLLGALSAAGSLFNKPQQSQAGLTAQQLAAIQQQQGALYNTPLNTNVPGRTAVAPNYTTPTAPTTPAQLGNPNSWYTYGSRPEATFFTNNNLQAYGWAKGGALSGEFSTRGTGSRQVRGPGTGVSDDVPARLSNGEYVLTAADVSRIGSPKNPSAPGANDRGARILDKDRAALARLVGQRQYEPRKSKVSINESSITHRGRAA